MILVRVDANPSIGAGHLLRCLALSQSLQSYGVKSTFLVSSNSVKSIVSRNDFSCDYITVPVFSDYKEEINWVGLQAERLAVKAIILDGYQFGEHYRGEMKGMGIPFILFDDENNSGRLYADVIINAVNEALEFGYAHTAPDATLLLGERYTLLRPEFCLPPSGEYNKRGECLLTFGAADTSSLTLPILKTVVKEASNLKPMTIVTGSAYRQLSKLSNYIGKYNAKYSASLELTPRVSHRHSVTNMRSIYEQSAIAISAAGGTVFELAAMGVPSILVVVADNQLSAALEQEKIGWCITFDARASVPLKQIVSKANELWNNENIRQEMHEKAYNSAIYTGAESLTVEILKVLNLPVLKIH